MTSFAALKRTDMNFDWSLYMLACTALSDGRPDIALDQYLLSYPGISDPDYEITQKNFVQLADFIYLLYATGEKNRSRALAERVLGAAPNLSRWGPTGYQSWDAHIHIALGDKDAALAALREFVEGGGAHAQLITDPFSEEIHGEPEFKRLIGIVQERLDTQKENLKRMAASGELAPMPPLKLSLAH